MFRAIKRGLTFTGIWPLLIILTLDMIYPTPAFSIPGVLSLFFAVFWTAKNTYSWYRARSKLNKANKEFDGVFFGYHPPYTRKQTLFGKSSKDDGHILVVGGAGTGKSSCIAIPTLKYFWFPSFLAVDIKGELKEKSGEEGYVFNPCNPQAYGYDPFYLVRQVDNQAAAIRDIALTIVPESPQVKEPFWVRAAQNILTGYLLSGFKAGEPFISLLKQIQSDAPEVVIKLAASDKEQAALFVSQYAGASSETLASIMSELSNHIVPFIGDPDIEASLMKDDIITPELLERRENIFLQIPEHRINQWRALVTLIIQQFLTHFERRQENNNWPILFLIDEFARFNRIDGIVNGLATLRSKKVTICILIQSLAQLDSIYGQDQRKIITDNCAYKIVLGATDADTQQYFSRLVGTEERWQESFTKDRKKIFFQDIVSSTISTVEKAIIKPEEFAYLKVAIALTPSGFFPLEKVPYYRFK